MKLTLTELGDLGARIEAARVEHERRFPGEPAERQPVHTVYVPADQFTAKTCADLGAEALRLLDAHAADGAAMAEAFGVEAGLGEDVRARVARKLSREPVEDLRVDFAGGYGVRDDEEEDGHITQAVEAVAEAYEARHLPFYWGLRVKSFTDGGHLRSMRTLDGFLTGLAERLGRLPGGFVVSLPKVVTAGQVGLFAEFLQRFEDEIGLPEGKLRFEAHIDSPQPLLELREITDAAAGRLSAIHFGGCEYAAACGLPPSEQRLDHPACDYARYLLQTALSATGVRLSDGAGGVAPASTETADVREAWRLHAGQVRHSLSRGVHQGWDTSATHLASRFAAVYAFYLDGLDDAINRLRSWRENPSGAVIDEPVTITSLTTHLRRAVQCGAIDADRIGDK